MFNSEPKCEECTIRAADIVGCCPLITPPAPPCGWRREENERRRKIKPELDEATGLLRKFIFREEST